MKVTYIDHMGTDLTVVNAAKVSFNKKSELEYYWKIDTRTYGLHLPERDISLIGFLARGCTSGEWEGLLKDVAYRGEDWVTAGGGDAYGREEYESLVNHIRNMPPHWTPFGHCQVSLHMKVPIFVARQIHKHQTGFVVNEVSRRYVTDEPEFYMPKVWRKRAENVKQGSSDEEVDVAYYDKDDGYETWPNDVYIIAMEAYKEMLKLGVCPEQARMVLPQSMYTEFYMTGSLFGWANLYKQRSDSHAQKEVQEVAQQIDEIIYPFFPESWGALVK